MRKSANFGKCANVSAMVKRLSQSPGSVRVRLQRLRHRASHFDELVHHAPVNFQVYWHARQAQAVGV
jgi:hypothetical protein